MIDTVKVATRIPASSAWWSWMNCNASGSHFDFRIGLPATTAEYIGKHCNVVGVDVVEYNPLQDIENKTAELGIELIARFLGKDYSWYSSYLNKNQL